MTNLGQSWTESKSYCDNHPHPPPPHPTFPINVRKLNLFELRYSLTMVDVVVVNKTNKAYCNGNQWRVSEFNSDKTHRTCKWKPNQSHLGSPRRLDRLNLGHMFTKRRMPDQLFHYVLYDINVLCQHCWEK